MDSPSGNFTKVPNELIRSDLPHSLKVAWITLASLCRSGETELYRRGVKDIADELGMPYTTLHNTITKLKKHGAVRVDRGELELIVPTEESLKYAEEHSIAEEVSEQPNVKSGVTKDEAVEMIKKAWNEGKPEGYLLSDGNLHPSLFIAIETQRKRNGLERPQVGEFVEQVCRGLNADAWWSKQTMKISSVFGWGAPRDKQFENVEKLYKAGGKVEKKVDFENDTDILARYYEKGRTELIRVIRLEAEDHLDGLNKLNAIPDEEYDRTTAYLYFAPGVSAPVYWTGKHLRPTMYLFS